MGRQPLPSASRAPLPTDPSMLPALPASFQAALDPLLDALGIVLSPGVRAAIEAQARLLLAWNEAINLTALRTPEKVALGHVADSLSALPMLHDLPRPGPDGLLDIGSGGGYPGLPLALALPVRRVALVESTTKKARFLAVAAAAAGLALRDAGEEPPEIDVLPERAEGLAARAEHAARWPLVTARAVAGLPQLAELALPLLAPGGALLAWKSGGPQLDREVAATRPVLGRLGGGEPRVHEVRLPGLEGHRVVVVPRSLS
ncbi:MAG TPA: RsmG family class I SAM-dependent methyltransferase [Candidatus Limnocylindrales bacterium]|nr:RsmG family class I SAM-dependent methyltransferase [Candidatus Limnocylindrales bacterium]